MLSKSTLILLAASLAGLSSAAPKKYCHAPKPTPTETKTPDQPTSTPGANDKFGLIALRSASPVHFASVSADQGNLWLLHTPQNASCDKPTEFATFYLQDGAAYLYAASATPQELYVDRSGMGTFFLASSFTNGSKMLIFILLRPRQARLHHWRSARSSQQRAHRVGH